MNLRKLINKMLISYFVLVTFILIAIMAVGMIFEPQAQFGYKSLASPLLYAFFGVIPVTVMYSARELSDKQIIVRKIIQLVVTEAEIMAFFILNPRIDTSEPKRIIGLMISVLAVFVISNAVNIMISCFSAQKLTKDLVDFQKNAG